MYDISSNIDQSWKKEDRKVLLKLLLMRAKNFQIIFSLKHLET